MSELIQRISAWRVVILKCALQVFISVGTFLVSSTQNWTSEYVDNLRWYHWWGLSIAALVIGCTTMSAFIDKTFHTEGLKIGLDMQVREEQVKADAKIAEIKQDVADAKENAKEDSKP